MTGGLVLDLRYQSELSTRDGKDEYLRGTKKMMLRNRFQTTGNP